MQKIDRKIVPRGYQKLILDLIELHTSKKKSVLLELDCGMGKRVITYELLTSLFPDKRILLVVLSSSSLHETKDFLQNEYGGVEGFNWIGPGISNAYGQKILKESRVILCTPQKLSNIMKKDPKGFANTFDIVIINEVDKLIRRMGSKRVLIYPWSDLLDKLESSLFIGMSGTLRDSHYVLDQDQLEIRKELDTLIEFIPDVELIFMDYLAGTDVTKFTKETTIEAVPVEDPTISHISDIIGQQLREAYAAIKAELKEEAPEYLEQVEKTGPQALLQAPVSESLRAKAQSLTLTRKYLFSMMPAQLKKFLWNLPDVDESMLPVIPQKVLKAVEIAQNTNKTVILCSYIRTAKTIVSHLTKAKIKPFLITGQIFDKNAVLQSFRKYDGKATIIMSPVGERDIDLPEADKLIIFDCVRTAKTVYQQLKRIRGGIGIFLYYNNSYEAKKVQSVISTILERYPWSTKIATE
ncbi:MAG: DEAD/DEAH box helicase family protein [Candidatus Heimdallarchaeota archaeon]|nr:DEAD/DEAH box helicase family protein [Candidatus Heimdallarchaeota archaeon]MBY8993479.1 DEAD/DEAH box helicase family protein [Candidatus Heimdallarchaeota archaeon]